jgi:hypothetical protein
LVSRTVSTPWGEVNVVAIQPDGLADPHAGDRQQTDQRPVGRLAQPAAEDRRCRHQRNDLLIGVQVRGRTSRQVRAQVGGRHLVRRIERVQVGGEPAHGREPERSPASAPTGERHPRERVLDRDHALAPAFEERDELGQQLLGARELVAECPADPQIVAELIVQRTHEAPPSDGHGRASALSRSRSTFA